MSCECSYLRVLVVIIPAVSSTFIKDSGCGSSKGCFSDCDDGSCTYLISWAAETSSVTFTIQAELSGSSSQYVSVGMSSTQSMDDASVTSCLFTNNGGGTFDYENSYNSGDSNIPVANPKDGLSLLSGNYVGNVLSCSLVRHNNNTDPMVFDLTNNYFMLYATGRLSGGIKMKHAKRSYSYSKIDLQSFQDEKAGYPIKIKLHGIFAVVSWMIFMNIGHIIARHYKPLWPNRTFFGAPAWFLVHRVLMVTGAALTITAFGLIIRSSLDIGETNKFRNTHPIIGIIVFSLVIINPNMGILRPSTENKYRPIFYFAHHLVGLVSTILAAINMFNGVQLQKALNEERVIFVLIACLLLEILTNIILEVLLRLGRYKDKQGENEFSNVLSMTSQDDESNQSTTTQQMPFAWGVKRVILGIYISVIVVLVIVEAVMIATSTRTEF